MSGLILAAGALCLLLSSAHPYWHMRVAAPQYPKGLSLTVYPNRIAGDVREIDMLNHYIGMKSLELGAQLERRLAIPGLIAAAVALVIAALLPRQWAIWLAVPACLVPLVFVGDLYVWLRTFGLNLDPKAPLSHAVKPFMPTLLGAGRIAQFEVVAWFGQGFRLALLGGLLGVVGALLRPQRRAGGSTARAIALAAAALLAQPAVSRAATLTVAPQGTHETLAAALEASVAGDIIEVRGGTHRGPIIVDHPVTLAGVGVPVIDGGGRGTVVTLAAPGIIFRGFTVQGSGDILAQEDAGIVVAAADVTVEANALQDVLVGISLHRAPRAVIRRNRLHGKPLPVARRGDLLRLWYSDDVRIEANDVTGGRDLVFWYAQSLIVRGNTVRAGRYGLHFMYCNDAVVEDNTLERNSVGAYLMYSTRLLIRGNRLVGSGGPSGYGLGLKDMEDTRIEENVIAENRVGFFLEHATAEITNNLVAGNALGMRLLPSAQGNRISGNRFVENAEQVRMDGASVQSINAWQGNFWSDYRGYDADRDGVGDVPYRSLQLFERLIDRFPAFRLYAGSPAARAIDAAAQLFPLFAPKPAFEDAQPLMRAQPLTARTGSAA